MRAMAVVLRAAARAMRRDLGSFFALNNFVLFILLLIYSNLVTGLPPRSAYPFLLLAGFTLLLPLSSDPLAKIPAIRLGMWPLAAWQRAGLRMAGLALSPVAWAAAILFLRAPVSLGLAFLALAAVLQAGLAALRISPLAGGVRIAIPGRLGPLIAAALRQMLGVLDTYTALVIALGGWFYRCIYSSPDASAYPVFSLLVALALSTYAQCLFGLDGDAAATRYGLLPLTAREIVLAKDAAYLGVLLLLTLPLNPVAGMTSGFTALALGHYPALRGRRRQHRWRFTSGALFTGTLQIVLGAALGLAAANTSAAVGLIPLAVYLWGLVNLSGPWRVPV
jgi:hypothetical protein